MKRTQVTNIETLPALYAVFKILGGVNSTFKTRGDQARSYTGKRDFYSDEMMSKLLLAFAGNYQFDLIPSEAPEKEATIELFDFLFELLENFIFFARCESDLCYLINDDIDTLDYICFLIAKVGGMVNSSEEITKTCPFLYLNQSLKSIIDNDYDITKTIKSTVKKYLDNLRGDRKRQDISLYDKILKLDEIENRSKYMDTIWREIQELKDDLKISEENSLSKEQENLIKELWGHYNALLALSRLRSWAKTFSVTPEALLQRLYVHVVLTDAASKDLYLSDEKPFFKNLIQLLPSEKLQYPPIDINQLKKELQLHLRLNSLLSVPNDNEHNLRYLLRNLFLDEYADLVCDFEHFYEHKIPTLIKHLAPYLYNHVIVNNIALCLKFLQASDKSKVSEQLDIIVAQDIDTYPHFIRKLIACLYVGIKLSEGHTIKNNAFSKYINIYLNVTKPSKDVYIFAVPDETAQAYVDKYQQKGSYDKLYGLVKIIQSYNLFIRNNNLNIELLLANPLNTTNSFLEDFFKELDLQNTTSNVYEQSKKFLAKKGTRLKNANVGIVDYDITQLTSSFIFELFGLPSDGHYSGTRYVVRFLCLPEQIQEDIRKAIKERLNT